MDDLRQDAKNLRANIALAREVGHDRVTLSFALNDAEMLALWFDYMAALAESNQEPGR